MKLDNFCVDCFTWKLADSILTVIEREFDRDLVTPYNRKELENNLRRLIEQDLNMLEEKQK